MAPTGMDIEKIDVLIFRTVSKIVNNVDIITLLYIILLYCFENINKIPV